MDKFNFLLIDDEVITLFINEKILAGLGIADEIKTAKNGHEALRCLNDYYKANKKIPDVIFLDINMPIMNGFEFLKAFQSIDIPEKNKITIAILTSSLDRNDWRKAEEFGVKHFFSKPLSEQLIRAVFASIPASS